MSQIIREKILEFMTAVGLKPTIEQAIAAGTPVEGCDNRFTNQLKNQQKFCSVMNEKFTISFGFTLPEETPDIFAEAFLKTTNEWMGNPTKTITKQPFDTLMRTAITNIYKIIQK